MEEIYCYQCGEELEDMDTVYIIGGGEYICENCRYDYYIDCEDCGALVYNNDIIAVEDGARLVCGDCADEYYTCNHCNGLYSRYSLAVNTFETTLCGRCYEEYYLICEGCGEIYHIDDGDSYYCYDCADERRDYILSYSHKPNPIFFGGGCAGYGVELEIDDGDVNEAAEDINSAGNKHIYLKNDSSLNDGIEIVTHPATLKYHMTEFPWNEILRTAKEYNFKSHDTNTCGLHIHASRALFGDGPMERDLNIAKCMLLIDAYWQNYIVPFSRRDYAKLDQWAKKPDAGISSTDEDYTAIDKAKKTANKGRYLAVNLQNYSTVEFRFFRGTLRRNTIIASIQFLDTLINYAKKTKLKDIFNKSFLEVFGNTGYSELTEYLKLRKLTKKEDK